MALTDPEFTEPSIAAALDDLISRAGITKGDLAERLGVSPSTVSRWTTGERAMPWDAIRSVDVSLGYTPGTLLRLAGLVSDDIDTRSAIAGDPDIDTVDAFLIAGLYERAKLRRQLD